MCLIGITHKLGWDMHLTGAILYLCIWNALEYREQARKLILSAVVENIVERERQQLSFVELKRICSEIQSSCEF
jgi:hypothetical protein